jgi:hypothetical protein
MSISARDALTAYAESVLSHTRLPRQLAGAERSSDAAASQDNLETYFVPRHLEVLLDGKPSMWPLATVLAEYPKLAIVSPPGAGKSSLLRHLASTYAELLLSRLPSDNRPIPFYLPIDPRSVRKCRSAEELVRELSRRQLPQPHADIFEVYVEEALKNGWVLLLLDDYDDLGISERRVLTRSLIRLFRKYPRVRLILTARRISENDFDGLSHLALASLSPLNTADVGEIAGRWYHATVRDSSKAEDAARAFSTALLANEALGRLATSPLWLRILLSLHYIFGQFPTRRVDLYERALELLPGNAVSSFRSDMLPVLCYVASEMMLRGSTQIQSNDLRLLIAEARKDLQIDGRSAVITSTQLSSLFVSFYFAAAPLSDRLEFNHRIFQEFLCAKGIVEGWCPRVLATLDLLIVLEPHFDDSFWASVIPLVAALSSRWAPPLIQKLTQRMSKVQSQEFHPDHAIFSLLGHCLVEASPLPTEVVRAAIRELVRFGGQLKFASFLSAMEKGPYNSYLQEELIAQGVDWDDADVHEAAGRVEFLAFLHDSQRKHLEAGKWAIEHARSVDPHRNMRLHNEFAGFDYASTVPISQMVRAQLLLWSHLAKGNASLGTRTDGPKRKSAQRTIDAGSRTIAEPLTTRQPTMPQRSGEALEVAVERLFREFFQVDDEVPWKVRRQKSGSQGGHDLSIEWSGKCGSSLHPKVRCHIECKNYSEPINLQQVAEKLLAEERSPPVIDYWILISPRANPSNELNRFLEREETEHFFPFGVQVWCPETGIDHFFGLEPLVYREFFEINADDPTTWDMKRREEVRAHWADRLRPLLRVPAGWHDYLRNPELLCVQQEDPHKLEATFRKHVSFFCRDEVGAFVSKPLLDRVMDWLASDQSTLLVLGEFGDGKSFFTYLLARTLTLRWPEDQVANWLPLRLALRRYPGNAREFLRQRLEEFGADVAGWTVLGKTSRRLVILDGFDEMSIELDLQSILRNIKALLECVQEFKGCKLLITSRTHFFERRSDAQRLLERLGNAPIVRIAPLDRKDVLKYLAEACTGSMRDTVARLNSMNDPIGLASKPLFLDMLQDVLNDPNSIRELDLVALYENHIGRSLRRKMELLDDPALGTSPESVVSNLRRILGDAAVLMQRGGRQFVFLTEIATGSFAQLLWDLSATDTLEDDARGRVSTRSLLVRVAGVVGEWPVDFFHRSIREYFVSLRFVEAVENGAADAAAFIRETPLNHEIIQFVIAQWLRAHDADRLRRVKEVLGSLVAESTLGSELRGVGGVALTVLYRLDPRCCDEIDCKNKNFDAADLEDADLSGKDFTGSSLRAANLTNVVFENANFECTNLTGARIAETAAVVSLCRGGFGEVIAGYHDGVIRRWKIGPGTRPISHIANAARIASPFILGVCGDAGAWLVSEGHLIFCNSDDNEEWVQGWRFPVRDDLLGIFIRDSSIAFTGKAPSGEHYLRWLNMKEAREIGFSSGSAGRCAVLGDLEVIWIDGEARLRARSLQGTEAVIASVKPTALDTWQGDRMSLAVGNSSGGVEVWDVVKQRKRLQHNKRFELHAHDGPVTSVCFLNDELLASGSTDRSIAIISWDGPDLRQPAIDQRLALRLRCKGMKVSGMSGDFERELLTRAILATEAGQ